MAEFQVNLNHIANSFLQSYLAAMLFTESGDLACAFGLVADPAKISPELLASATADCRKFYNENHALFTDENCKYTGCTPDEYAAHDFWMTRNGHGVGFWDGGWAEPAATELHRASKAFGEMEVYTGDDGMYYGL
jgi:hypothetical protein